MTDIAVTDPAYPSNLLAHTSTAHTSTDHTSAAHASAAHASAAHASAGGEALRGALLDSRQRWRDLVMMTADFAFETDEWGRFSFVSPDPTLGWSSNILLGRSSSLLLADAGEGTTFNPFRTTVAVRRRRAWLRRGDGGLACMVFAAAPLLDETGAIIGARGLGIDLTEQDGQSATVATALRRGEVLDHILWRVGQEVLAPRMMRAALEALVNAMGAEGSGVITLPDGGRHPALTHEAGHGAEAVLASAAMLLEADTLVPPPLAAAGERPILATACQTRFGDRAGLAVWRASGARAWDEDDRLLIGSAASVVRMILEHESIQKEMARQARTDPLTGLLNRRAFLEELERRVDRLDREGLPGTLMFADLDNFKPVNDMQGHEMGDQVLLHAALMLRRTVRPSDLVARLGGDEFALWLDGADHLTAAERAEQLRQNVPTEMAEITGPEGPQLSLSIGIAARRPGTDEMLDELMRRADLAMYDVKRNGRGHWRVSPEARQ